MQNAQPLLHRPSTTGTAAAPLIAWPTPSPSCPAPSARRCAASGLNRSMLPSTPADHPTDASFSICRNENPTSQKFLEQNADTLDPFESAKSRFFDTSNWGPFCDVTLTLKQGCRSDSGAWVKINDYGCRQAFRHFMNLLNGTVYGAAFRRYRKRLRVLPVLEKGEIRTRTLRSWERGTSGRWHIHCAIELPSHFDAIALEGALLGEGRIMGLRPNSCPRLCEGGLDSLHAERTPEVSARRLP